MRYPLPTLFLALAASLTARAQSRPATGPTLASFVPAGYRVPPGGQATGDLNGDGRPDAALVLADTARGGTQPRPLLVLLGRAGGGYRLALTAKSAILCATCGGVLGDPFEQVSISKGVLSIIHRGGSRESWSLTVRFRYQQGDFYQIGETYDVTDRLGHACRGLRGHYLSGTVHRDENLLTGQYESIQVSDGCKFMDDSRGRHPVKPLVRLASYHRAP